MFLVKDFTGFTINAAPRVLDFQRTRASAALYTEIAYRAKLPDGKVVDQASAHVFQLVRQGGAWRLGNDDFVQELLPPSLAGGDAPWWQPPWAYRLTAWTVSLLPIPPSNALNPLVARRTMGRSGRRERS